MPDRLDHEVMAMLVAREFREGDVINLGTGLPAICSDYVPPEMEVLFHSEQGLIGFGAVIRDPGKGDPRIRSMAGLVEAKPGMSFMSHDESFMLVNSGRLSCTVLGALQVDQQGNLANYQRPGRITGSIGGAGDLAGHAKRVIIMMTHVSLSGEPKIVEACTLPITTMRCVDLIVTDVAVMRVTDRGIVLQEFAPGWTFDVIQKITGARLIAASDMREASLV